MDQENEARLAREKEEKKLRDQQSFQAALKPPDASGIKRNSPSAMSILMRGSEDSSSKLIASRTPAPAVESTDFDDMLTDTVLDPEERELLKSMQQKRLQEEAQRKRLLQEEYEKQQREAQMQQMLEFQKINDQRRKEIEDREKDMKVYLARLNAFTIIC